MRRLPSLSVRNAQRKRAVDVPSLQQFAERACELCRETKSDGQNELEHLDEVTIVLVADRRIAALHQQFMNIDGPTDVLTFHHGEVFVSVETAERNAAEFGTTAEDEMRLYIVHGLLHLRGFDDVDPEEARRMSSVQERILAAAAATAVTRPAGPAPV